MESDLSQNCNSVLRYPLEVSAKHKLSIISIYRLLITVLLDNTNHTWIMPW